jgi:hypothetical protein
MATWKRLTATSGTPVEVNMDAIAYMNRPANSTVTTIYFNSKDLSTTVKETPDEIAGENKLFMG